MKSLSWTIKIKTAKQYFSVVLFVMHVERVERLIISSLQCHLFLHLDVTAVSKINGESKLTKNHTNNVK